ncbi:MAG: 3-methyl-2-oxobutanoate hydroxymethyltransferase [Candidatus Diapherotrites archaeon CG11_big_fil_rev_8_21_14_0_20_37_9]|nr:MAG: 3-methyl-2-oxobutanoate hydroxymethyltransferase [Candidatus Diapherotrites archaeon CG11_big_fil_rev_8_21_14_0_20_37_9]
MTKIVMVTAYDYPSAKIVDEAGIDIILVGDSVANVVHGMKSTREIGMNEMLVHVKAVARAEPKAMIIADMPYRSYSTPKTALANAKKFLKAGANAVKIEGQKQKIAKALSKNKIRVMGHIGYLPQSDAKPIVKKDAEKLIDSAIALEKAGCSWIVLELVPEKISRLISDTLTIPTIGIGAGKYCAGQVLVFHDLVGLNADDSFNPRFLKKYANLKKDAVAAVKKYAKDIQEGKFPAKKNSY